MYIQQAIARKEQVSEHAQSGVLNPEDATQKAPEICCTGRKNKVSINKGDWKLTIQTLVDQNDVMIFSITTCSFCSKVKDLFKSMNVSYSALELDQTGGNPLSTYLVQAPLTSTGLSFQSTLYMMALHSAGQDLPLSGDACFRCSDSQQAA
ncbi:Glutaredoxin-2, mitochondrial [Varanus komodoensis]|nr:Glutaredoxin-2, mitochondrial [Varanus komodoensis]